LVSGISAGIDLYNDFRLTTARSLTLNSRVNRIEDLTMWFETTSELSFQSRNPIDKERIALWKNINLNLSDRINVSQATQNSKPIYTKSAINNLPALRFDNAQLLTADNVKISEIVSSDQATVFVVQNNFSGDATTTTFGWQYGTYRFQSHAQEGDKVLIDYGSTTVPSASRTSTPTLTNFLNQNKIITFIKNGSNVKIKINSAILANSSIASATINPSLVANFSIGKYLPDINYYFFGYIGELIIFKKSLSDSEIKDIEQYLSKKWGIKLE
jgi:hypothetical protein